MDYEKILDGTSFLKDMVDYLQMCQTLFWVLVVINIIVLIAFFILCGHIGKIKKRICLKNEFGAIFNFYFSIGDIEKAKECLFQEIVNDELLEESFFMSAEYSEKMRGYFIGKYHIYLDKLGLKIDFDKVDEFIHEFKTK